MPKIPITKLIYWCFLLGKCPILAIKNKFLPCPKGRNFFTLSLQSSPTHFGLQKDKKLAVFGLKTGKSERQ